MKKKDIKAFQGLEAVIDENYKLLCDRVRLLEKSHKRMMRVFKLIKNELDMFPSEFLVSFVQALVDDELERKVL